jgi:hypothetical protein
VSFPFTSVNVQTRHRSVLVPCCGLSHSGGCVAIQSGGSARDLYYLPADISKAICVDKDLNESFWLNAGIQVRPLCITADPLV